MTKSIQYLVVKLVDSLTNLDFKYNEMIFASYDQDRPDHTFFIGRPVETDCINIYDGEHVELAIYTGYK